MKNYRNKKDYHIIKVDLNSYNKSRLKSDSLVGNIYIYIYIYIWAIPRERGKEKRKKFYIETYLTLFSI